MARTARRLFDLAVVLLVVSAVTFLLLDLLPGGPAQAILGNATTAQSIATVEAELGLDRPLPVRFVAWLGDALTGDLGRSYRSKLPVDSLVRDAFIPSFELVLLAQAFALVVAVPLAVRSARRPGGLVDRAVSGASIAVIGLPQFAVGIVFLALFSVRLGWFPAADFTRLGDSLFRNLRSLFLPR